MSAIAGPVVLIGAGGIGAPAAIALASGGVESLVVVDDDRVDTSNLHRQILFRTADVGRDKLDAFRDALARRAPAMRVTAVRGRALPESAAYLVAGASVVVDATDNFAARFLLADACRLAGVPVVHAAALRWTATVMAVSAIGAPCYRCLFEDIPREGAPTCATAGVIGPVCGAAGAIAADRAIAILRGDRPAFGEVVTFDGRAGRLRAVRVVARPDCPLCGLARSIASIEAPRYASIDC